MLEGINMYIIIILLNSVLKTVVKCLRFEENHTNRIHVPPQGQTNCLTFFPSCTHSGKLWPQIMGEKITRKITYKNELSAVV